MEVIILAGGFGTRLQSVVKNIPKPMAEINSKPFLEYLLQHLLKYGIKSIILSVGYQQDIIKNHFKNSYKDIPIKYSCEDKALGTGGAIKKALEVVDSTTNRVFVVNGDTFFNLDLDELEKFNASLDSDITLSLKNMKNFDRYGSVEVDYNIVKSFKEKKFYKEALINCGVYIIKKDIFKRVKTADIFSFEEFLENCLEDIKVSAYISNNSYFIDIGIPSDYKKAQIDFINMKI